MSMEKMEGPLKEDPQSGAETSREIEQQEAELAQTSGKITELLDEAEHRDNIDAAAISSIRERYTALREEVNEKFIDRIKNWPFLAGVSTAFGGAMLVNPGGIEGVQIGAVRFVEGGAVAAAAATALWGLARLQIWLQERK